MSSPPPAYPTPAATPRLQRSWLALALVGVLAFAALLAARPTYRAVKRWRARGLADQAEKFLLAQKWKEASEKAQAAYQLNPVDPRTLRVVARLYADSGNELALSFWDSLIAMGQATPDDRRALVRLALQLGRLEPAAKQIGPLLELAPDDGPTLELAADVAAAQGDLAAALKYARRATALEPGQPAPQLALGRLLLASTNVADQAEARRLLLPLATGRDQNALDALILMTRLRDLTWPDATFLVERLTRHPLTTVDYQTQAAELLIRQRPAERTRFIDRLLNEYRVAEPKERLALARWLNAQKEYGRLLDWIPLNEARQDRDLYMLRLDAQAALGRWAEIGETLESKPTPLEGWVTELYRARVAQQTGQTEEAALQWRRVQLDVPRKAATLRYVAQYAEQTGELDEATKAYRRLAELPESAADAYAGLMRLADRNGSTRTARDLVKEFTRIAPDNAFARADLAYLNLLLGDDVPAAAEVSRQLYESNTNFVAYRVTRALALFELKETKNAQRLLAATTNDWSTAPAGWQAIRAAIIGGAGDATEARRLARAIPADRLRPEERDLLQPWAAP